MPGPLSRPRGMSLIELLAVIGIVSTMLGFSAVAYWRMSKSFKEQGAASEIDVALRQARNSAISANAPAFVEVDTENRRVIPWLYRTVGLWHFEDRTSYGVTRGAFHNATMRGAEHFPDGKIGKCAKLREGACIDAGTDPDFDCEDGGFLEAFIRPATDGFAGDNFIFSKQDAYFLKIGNGGVLIGNTGAKNIQSDSYRISPGRWSKVALAWDRQSTRIIVDDGVVAAGPGTKPKLSDFPLLIGHASASFSGLVDEVRVMSAAAGNSVELPRDCSVSHTAAPWNAVHFAADGSLDMRYHAGPVSIVLTQSTRMRSVNVSMLGMTTRAEVENVTEAAVAAEKPVHSHQAPRKNQLTLFNDDGTPQKNDDAKKSKGASP